jgi:deazaflavin-dependent oxidoreductase (nitroreductase family)
MSQYADANVVHRIVRRLAATRPGSWFFARTLHHLDRVVYRLSRERTTCAAVLSGLPVVMLTSKGAKSGRETTVPLLGFEEGEAVILVASNYGQAQHPAWYHNLRTHPRVRIAVRGQSRDVLAEQVESPDRERYLAVAKQSYPGYSRYELRAAPRRIAVFRLIPRQGILSA